MITYRKGRPEERADIVDFANYVFSQAHRPHDFKALLPKVYADHISADQVADCHYLCVVDGKIKAMVGCPIVPISYAGECFRMGLVGSVSVHPYARREGYMKGVMNLMLEDSEKRGADMLILGGQHQRYQHFGFELSGASYDFRFSPASVRHAWGDLNIDDTRFEKMGRNDPLLNDAYSLYRKEIITGSRTRDDFFDICCSWNAEPWAILMDGSFVGYLLACDDGTILELVLQNEPIRDTVLKAWSTLRGDAFTVSAHPYQVDRIEAWLATCDNYSVENQEMIRVFHWLPVLRAAMALRCAEGNCQFGNAVLELDGKKFSITVNNGKSTVVETDTPADASFEGIEAIRRVFGMGTALCRSLNPLKNNWLPLPFSVSASDKF